ncbi:hypothetical protein PBY51_024801 [Eleginops maclovinus]|uniref:Uncharacterized protein n=1 Tax=Eleginops maclovinus TaxID=56733 RepID=A0AAN7XZC8_ELEMC|nr:hypothetical protein PBY51_024801 [Eleginops maclovinus]
MTGTSGEVTDTFIGLLSNTAPEPTVLKPRHGIRSRFKTKQEAALCGEVAVNTGRAMPVQKTDEHSAHHTLTESVKGATLLNRIIS